VIGFTPGLGLALSIKRARHKECFSAYIKTVDVGRIVPGVITKKIEYGAFVRLHPGVEGLAHINEASSPEVFGQWETGQELDFLITSINYEQCRIGLADWQGKPQRSMRGLNV